MLGRRPVAAFGDWTGDRRQVLEYPEACDGARLGMRRLHDSAERDQDHGPADGLPGSRVCRGMSTVAGEYERFSGEWH